jgi:hypothetical protein
MDMKRDRDGHYWGNNFEAAEGDPNPASSALTAVCGPHIISTGGIVKAKISF